jgi:hypothetical protein
VYVHRISEEASSHGFKMAGETFVVALTATHLPNTPVIVLVLGVVITTADSVAATSGSGGAQAKTGRRGDASRAKKAGAERLNI